MGYILDLRKIEGIGQRPLQMVACGVFLFDTQERVLLEQRTDDGTWCVPGGSMELGETPEETAKRECMEETGLIAKELQLYNVQSGEKCHFIYPNGDEVYAVDINFVCRSFEGALKGEEEEVVKLQFFDRGDLPENCSGNDKEIIEEIWKNAGSGICYSDARNFSAEDTADLFQSVNWISGNYPERVKKALDNCETVFTAWKDGRLVGLVNAMDDGELTAYVHYLCVNPEYQGMGIGKELLRRIKEKYNTYLYIILIAESESLVPYYQSNGFELVDGRYVFTVEHHC